MKIFSTLAMVFCCLFVSARQTISLIPQPVHVQQSDGIYTLPAVVGIKTNDSAAASIAAMLSSRLNTSKGEAKGTSITLTIHKPAISTIKKEGYKMQVNSSGVNISANDAAGLFYGAQTLLQLLPPAIEAKTLQQTTWQLPYVTITDYPRFGWRGLMLDVSRHFFTKAEVKGFIDNMVKYKYNMLHLHLTDDQGWRLEIKSLPALTSVGAWRAPREGRWGEFTKPTPDEPKTYGGFYTHGDIKELLAYAKERFVTIVPEIDIPGHSMAMLAAYPELSCTPGTYQVNAGDRFMIWPGNGTFYGITDNNLCPANEKVYEVLDKVFTEVAQLFPFEYIHMGGDECYKGFWEKSDAIAALMKREGLKDQHEVQSYFVKRVAKIIASKGKKMLGWDEIMEGGLADNAAVMSWRGEKGGKEAAALKHPVVMAPNTHAYLDLYQGDPVAEPPTYSMVRFSQSYKFNPVPDGVDSAYILGGQANLWAERLYTMRQAEYMLWPRALAIAESVWSPVAAKNWTNFVQRTEQHFNRFDAAQTKYSRSMYDPIFSAKKLTDSTVTITLSTEVDGLDIHYCFDETLPDNFYPVYKMPLTVPKDAANLKVITYRHGRQEGKLITMPIAELKKRAGIKK